MRACLLKACVASMALCAVAISARAGLHIQHSPKFYQRLECYKLLGGMMNGRTNADLLKLALEGNR